jgi:hypothetical protein
MSAVNAAFTVDTFVNNGSVNSADDLTIQKKTEDGENNSRQDNQDAANSKWVMTTKIFTEMSHDN